MRRSFYSKSFLRTFYALTLLVLSVGLSPFATAQSPTPKPTPKSKTLTLVFGVFRPPYIFEKRDEGIDYDLAIAAFERVGYSVKSIHSPNNRALREVEMGKVDGAIGLPRGKDTAEIYYSEPELYYDNVAVSKKSSGIEIKRIADLAKHRFLAFSSARTYLGAEYAGLVKDLKYDTEISNQSDQNRLFWTGKIPVVVLDLNVFRYYQKHLGQQIDTSEEIVVHRIFAMNDNARVGAFRSKTVRDDYNRGLVLIKASGRYQQIIDQYLKVNFK